MECRLSLGIAAVSPFLAVEMRRGVAGFGVGGSSSSAGGDIVLPTSERKVS